MTLLDHRPRLALDSPADLQRLMGADYPVSDQQWQAVAAPLEPAVVVAGAGSGKTTLMAARVVYLVATGQVTPDQVLGLTFTTKAASELGQRVRAGLAAAGLSAPRPGRAGRADHAAPHDEEEPLEPLVSTYNAYAAGLLAEHGLRIGHEPDTRVMADASRYQLAARVIERHTAPVAELSDSPKHVVDYMLRLDAALGEHLVTPDRLREFDAVQLRLFAEGLAGAKADLKNVTSAFARRAETLSLVEEYRSLKATLGLMDFSDQIAMAARLVDAHPGVGQAERERYRVVMLDEYQDTSVAQAQMLRRLFGGGHPVTAVGDPNQAIYGWRGASVSNILRFEEDFPRADGGQVVVHPLTINRRSDQRILQVANRLAEPLQEAFPQVAPLQPGTDAAGEVETVVHPSYDAELAWLVAQVRDARTAMTGPCWREIGVLVRDNAHAADVFDTLTAGNIPVEIVGLKGLLRLPEVAEVLATLSVLDDLTANADLLTLLTGPRWSIGPRDLALLGRRAATLAGFSRGRSGDLAALSVDEELAAAVAGADPTEVVALGDALDDPGDLPYSAEALDRFARLAAELRTLRRHTDEPLMDIVRRIVDASGVDVELASSTSESARARRENLDLFVKAVAEFQAIDGSVSLTSLLAWLEAEEEGNGLDAATPSEADSVKLLTVHRAKGLEWDVVFVVGACAEKFPVVRSRGLWPTRVELLPTPLRGDARDLPTLTGHDRAALARLKDDTKAHEAVEELRLGYVAFTRARHRLLVSSYLWKEQRKGALGPSPYQVVVRDVMATWGGLPLAWEDKPDKDTPNPLLATTAEFAWPVTEQTAEARRRAEAAALVAEELARLAVTDDALLELPTSDPSGAAEGDPRVAEWDAEIARLLVEARRATASDIGVDLPVGLSATAVSRLRDDPEVFARDLARPMPRRPSAAARFGTRFHAWVEARFGQQELIDLDDIPGRSDAGIDDEADLALLVSQFESGPFATRVPRQVEAPFALVLAGQVVRGRIDAVYDEPDGGFLVVDWKTGRAEHTDPLQLALYRLAWAELHDVPLSRVRAAFYLVRAGEVVEPDDLPDRAGLEAVLELPRFTGSPDG